MAKERSFVRKRRRGCLTGCLTRTLLLLGLLALLLVGACVLGLVKTDETGKPTLSLSGVSVAGLTADDLKLPQVSLPHWAYGLQSGGLTVKTLRAGDGEAVLVCCDGYTMLLGAGSGSGAMVCAQLLLCGVTRLNVAVAMSAEPSQTSGMRAVLPLMRPEYLIYQDSQTKDEHYNRMIAAAEKAEGLQKIVPEQGLTFSLGRATVTVIGPASTAHADERDDGLSVRVDYGNTSVLAMGTVTAAGESEIVSTAGNLRADALICARGGGAEATGARLVQAVSPRIALMTGKEPANPVRVRLAQAGAQVYAAAEHGVMTLVSDGATLSVEP